MVTKDNFKLTERYGKFINVVHMAFEKDEAINRFLEYLECETDYHWAPASTKYHSAYPGGLVAHSINVYDALVRINTVYELKIGKESLIICGLFHDLGKVNFYIIEADDPTIKQMGFLESVFDSRDLEKLKKQGLTKGWASELLDWHTKGRHGDSPEKHVYYKIKDDFPIGHTVRGLILLLEYLFLTKEEKLAIRWHSGLYEAGDSYENRMIFDNARNTYPLVAALIAADYEAAFIGEKIG